MTTYNLTRGSILGNLVRFSLPYLLSCFLQTFYGLADLFITARFNGAAAITAVSVGSQLTHMLTVVVIGLSMGSTVAISRCVGAGDKERAAKTAGNTVVLFAALALGLTVLLLGFSDAVLDVLLVPSEARAQAASYIGVCFLGIPLLVAYNVLGAIYRGLGDTRHPMYFVMAAGIFNVGLDFLLIGGLGMGAFGAALATVASQAVSVLLALRGFSRKAGFALARADFRPERDTVGRILRVGVPTAAQDGLIQVSFLVITAIANHRGVEAAAAVGIVEKVISFLFLVPSAMLSSVSAICAQNIGAGLYARSRSTLRAAIATTAGVGLFFAAACQFSAPQILSLFTREEPRVVLLGAQYLRTYSLDCFLAGIHFCFSGYFCACERPSLSFFHNLISILTVRIPGAYLASVWWPQTLAPMGLAAPMGSLLSILICLVLVCRKPDSFGLPTTDR